MALRTNSKKAAENLYKYIKFYTAELFEDQETTTRADLYTAIYKKFVAEEKPRSDYNKRYHERAVFESWAQGLACNGLFCYYYNRSALDDIATILEETEEEKSRYKEEDAEKLLTSLIYREITARKN